MVTQETEKNTAINSLRREERARERKKRKVEGQSGLELTRTLALLTKSSGSISRGFSKKKRFRGVKGGEHQPN